MASVLAGADPGREHPAPPPPPPPKIGKNKIFWRKIVIFHTKYPKHVRASLRSAQFFKNPGLHFLFILYTYAKNS